MTDEQREMIEMEAAERAMHTEVVEWEDYPFDPNEEENFSDFAPEYRCFDMESDEIPF